MFKPKLIRLLIYLVISIGLIVLLFNIPIGSNEKSKKEISKVKQKLKEGIPVDISSLDDFVKYDAIKVYIDSNDIYFIDGLETRKDSIEIQLQKIFIDTTKRGIILEAEKKASSENIVFILDLVNKNHWRIGIATGK